MIRAVQLDKLEIIDDLSRLSIEVEARKELISFMLTNNMDCGTSQFLKYQKEYLDFFTKYQAKKQEFEMNIRTSILEKNEKLISWNLDFNTRELTLTVSD